MRTTQINVSGNGGQAQVNREGDELTIEFWAYRKVLKRTRMGRTTRRTDDTSGLKNWTIRVTALDNEGDSDKRLAAAADLDLYVNGVQGTGSMIYDAFQILEQLAY